MINIDSKQIKLQIWDTVQRCKLCNQVDCAIQTWCTDSCNMVIHRLARSHSGPLRGHITGVQQALCWSMTSQGKAVDKSRTVAPLQASILKACIELQARNFQPPCKLA